MHSSGIFSRHDCTCLPAAGFQNVHAWMCMAVAYFPDIHIHALKWLASQIDIPVHTCMYITAAYFQYRLNEWAHVHWAAARGPHEYRGPCQSMYMYVEYTIFFNAETLILLEVPMFYLIDTVLLM